MPNYADRLCTLYNIHAQQGNFSDWHSPINLNKQYIDHNSSYLIGSLTRAWSTCTEPETWVADGFSTKKEAKSTTCKETADRRKGNVVIQISFITVLQYNHQSRKHFFLSDCLVTNCSSLGPGVQIHWYFCDIFFLTEILHFSIFSFVVNSDIWLFK